MTGTRSRRLGVAAAHAAVTFLAFVVAEALGIALALGLYEASERPHQLSAVDPLVLIGIGAALAGTVFGLAFVWLVRRDRGINPRYSYTATLMCIAGAEWTALFTLFPLWLLPIDRLPPMFLASLWWAIVSGIVYRAGIALFFCLAMRFIIAAPLPRGLTAICFVVGISMMPISWILAYATESQIGEWPLPALAVAIMAGIVRFAIPTAPANSVAR